MSDLPNFAAWNHETLAKFALDSYLRMQAQQEAIEQLRGDLNLEIAGAVTFLGDASATSQIVFV